ncbi:MAG: hypothetical protein ACK50A_17680 [Sphingobacteriaceae bacterium]|jgi:hypothetical protein
MKYFIPIWSIVLFCGCAKEDRYLKMYPFFKNVSVHKEDGTVILNNFNSENPKEGLEYLIDTAGFLIEARFYKKNYLNGYTARYSRKGKISLLGYMSNDTLNGDYFVFDTLSSSIKQYREYLNMNGQTTVNQIISFSNGKINYNASSFFRIKKIESELYRITLFSNFRNPFLAAYYCSSDVIEHDFYKDNYSDTIVGSNGNYIDLNVRDPKKFVKGYFINYRLATAEEIKQGAIKDDKIGPVIYFKFPL